MSDTDLRQFRLARQQLELKRGKIRLQMDQRRWDKLQEEDEAEAAEADGGKGDGEARYERTVSALATRFGISRTTMAGLTRAPDAPRKHGKKGYIVTEWGQWLLKRKMLAPVESAERSARARLIAAKADAAEMANKIKAGKFVGVAEVADFIRFYSKAVADAIDSARNRAIMRGLDAGLVKVAEEMAAEVHHVIRENVGRYGQ